MALRDTGDYDLGCGSGRIDRGSLPDTAHSRPVASQRRAVRSTERSWRHGAASVEVPLSRAGDVDLQRRVVPTVGIAYNDVTPRQFQTQLIRSCLDAGVITSLHALLRSIEARTSQLAVRSAEAAYQESISASC